MIISAKKPIEEVRASVAPYEKLAIIGCGGCAAVCQTGGTKQVEELAGLLDDKETVFTFQVDEPCDQRILARELRRISDRLALVDAVVILACGIGVQTIACAIDKPCLTGLNTMFPGTVIHANEYIENCAACGECLLNLTAGLCPRTRCPKGIGNGPCSEKLDTMCSVEPESECVWITIASRREAAGMPAVMPDVPPINWAERSTPRRVTKKRT